MDKTEFKESNLFEKYDRWISGMIAGDYYTPECFDEEGNLISEPSFDERSFEKAEEEILDISIDIYEEIAYGRISTYHPEAADYASIVADLLHHHKYCDAALLGTVYYLFVYDYPNYKPIMGNKMLIMRSYNELFTRVSVYTNCIKEWLDLYSSLRNITSVLALPPYLREERVLKYLNRLRDKGVLDDNYQLSYQFTCNRRKGAWSYLIANHLCYKGVCKKTELERFWGGNLRDNRQWESFDNEKSRGEAKESEMKLFNSIENCFKD